MESKLVLELVVTVKKAYSKIEPTKALNKLVSIFLFRCQYLCEKIFIMLSLFNARVLRLIKCYSKHKYSSKSIHKNIGFGLY